LISLVQSLAAEVAASGARVNAVCPGNVDSPMLRALAQQVADREQQSPEQVLAQFAAASAFDRLLTPQEVAQACSWLASPEASGISGQVVVVDGPPPG
jgi:NAD(P)-dependent dehydrogenase (short-subunit alcohol dehydrogenase family)